MIAYSKMFRNYFNFSGKTSRSDYIKATLMHILVIILAAIVDDYFGLYFFSQKYGMLLIAYGLFSVFPYYSMQYRRVRDTGLRWPIFIVVILTTVRILNYIFYIFLAFKPTAKDPITQSNYEE